MLYNTKYQVSCDQLMNNKAMSTLTLVRFMKISAFILLHTGSLIIRQFAVDFGEPVLITNINTIMSNDYINM